MTEINDNTTYRKPLYEQSLKTIAKLEQLNKATAVACEGMKKRHFEAIVVFGGYKWF
jgi:hypothetical protein